MSAVIMSGTGGKQTVWFYAREQVGRRRSDRLSERMAFSYRVSLQVRHPDADPEKMIAGTGRAARRYWKAGEERTTLKGTPLPGTYRESYCVFDLGEGEDGQLAVFLRRTLVELEQVAEFINELRQTGGKVNY